VGGLDTIDVRFSVRRDAQADVTHPIPLETVLIAEITALDAQLQARRALQSPSVIVTIGP
jgi:hypothetical protein